MANEEVNITDRKNAWKLAYASMAASEYSPRLDDEQLEYAETEVSYFISELKKIGREELDFWQVDYSDALRTFARKYERGEISCPFTCQKYKDNKDIIGTIEAYGLDVEKFWYAILFIYWFTQVTCVNVIEFGDTTGEQMQKLKEFLHGIYNFTITVEGKKKLTVSDSQVIRSLHDFLDKTLNENEYGLSGHSFKLNAPASDLLSPSKQMYFSAMRYMKLFENLNLPSMRAKDSKTEHKNISYNKMLLISRLLYFTRLTKNENFLYSDESLKGIMKQYKGLKINTVNPLYLF